MHLKDYIPLWLRGPRNTVWLIATVVLIALVFLTAPGPGAEPQVTLWRIALYKAALISLAAVMGYWLDRALYPYARPDSYLARDWRYGTNEPEGEADYPVAPGYMLAFCTAMIRRSITVAATVIGMALGM